jgi:hypothetical protein
VTAGGTGERVGVAEATGATGVLVRVAAAGTVVDVPGVVGVELAVGTAVFVDVGTLVGVFVAVATVGVALGLPATGVEVLVAVSVGVSVEVCTLVGVSVDVATPVGVSVDVATPVGVSVDVGTPVGVSVAVGAVGVALGLRAGVVGVLVAVGTPVGVSVAAGDVAVEVGVAATQGGKLGDFSGLRSGLASVSVSMRNALARGSTAAVEIGPNGTTTCSPGSTVTSSTKLPPGTGTNSAVPPRDGGMCCINWNGMLSLIVDDVSLEIVTVPETPPGPQPASISSIVRPAGTLPARLDADALAMMAAPSASAIRPATKWPLREGITS